ncbi:hypothetical protein HDU76_004293, partial [Blyttiomyces sp. JEL0837]
GTPSANPLRVTGFARGGGFGVVNNVDISGFDLAGPFNVPSVKACARLCAGNAGCGWSNFVQGTGCYLKVPQAAGNAFTWFNGATVPFSGDIPFFDLQGPFNDASPNACLTRCTQTPNCQWANYILNQIGVQCYLKTGTPANGKSIVFNLASPLSTQTQQGPPPVPAIGGQFVIPAVCDRSGQNKQFCTGAVGIHAILTSGGSAGKVLFFERPHFKSNPFVPIVNPLTVVAGGNHPYGEVASVYDLATNTFTPIQANDNPFCAGHTLLSNGHVLIAGGDDPKDGDAHASFHIDDGLKLLRDFDPFTNTWTILGQMTSARWYPTLLQLPDDRIMIWGGITDDQNGQAVNSWEIFNPTTKTSGQTTNSPLLAATVGVDNQGRSLAGGPGQQNLYPFIKVLPDGNLFLFASQIAKFFNTKTLTEFGNLPNTPGNFKHNYPQSGACVLLPLRPDGNGQYSHYEVLITGGSLNDASANDPSSYRMDLSPSVNGNYQWVVEQSPSPRAMGDTVLLPNGQVFLVNGAISGGAAGGEAGTSANRNPNFDSALYTPDAAVGARWQPAARSTIRRLYHSTALLLPDGTVMISGSDQQSGIDPNNPTTFEYQVEIYQPPYKFSNGPGPTIRSAPAQLNLSQQFVINVIGNVDQVSLVKLGSITHGNNQDQRVVFLKIAGNANGQVTAVMPNSHNVVMRGDYMLFVLNQGVPSHSQFVRVL